MLTHMCPLCSFTISATLDCLEASYCARVNAIWIMGATFEVGAQINGTTRREVTDNMQS